MSRELILAKAYAGDPVDVGECLIESSAGFCLSLLTLLSRQSAVNAAAELAQLTAERDALRARVAELEADLKPKAGRCELGDALCNCGGDVPAIRYGCANWRCV